MRNNLKNMMLPKLTGLLLIIACFAAFVIEVSAGSIFPEENEIRLMKGDLETIKTNGLTRVSITNPDVADIVNIDTEHILMIGRNSGTTTLFAWDKHGKHSIVIRVTEGNLESIKLRIQQLLAKADITTIDLEVSPLEERIIASGAIDPDDQATFEEIISPFYDNILDLTKEKEDEDLIQIDAQISELSLSFSESLGIDWTSAFDYTETLPTGTIHDFGNIFKLGKFSRATAITSTINALITEGKGRVLSRPKLVVLSGKEASFLVGGEIPVTETTATSGGSTQENVEFKDYGVALTIRPTVKKNNKINIGMELEVSDVDAANSSGGNPAFTTRNAQTEVLVNNKQTVVIAGLVKSNKGRTLTKVPFLGDIPLVGAFFRSKATPTAETELELVITLTPTILDKQKSVSSGTTAKVSGEETAKGYSVSEGFSYPQAFISQESAVAKILVPQGVASYGRAIQEKIAQRIIYPEEARRYGWEGTVKLALHIDGDGILKNASVKESSGHDLFDKGALEVVQSLAPYSGFPLETGLQELTLTIPIVYSLEFN